MKKVLVVLIAMVAGANIVVAQQGDYPPNAEPGKCYAKCVMPDIYENETVTIKTREAGKKIIPVPAKYETQMERVLVKEASSYFKAIPAKYKTEREIITVKEETTKWVKTRGNKTCLSANPEDCKVWCLQTVPPVKKAVYKKVIDRPASKEEVTIDAVYKNVPKRVLVAAATTREEIISEQFRDETKKVLKKKGGWTEWKEVLCDANLTNTRVLQIQKALIAKGYDVGPYGVDNIIGADTRRALEKYQAANGLPVGNLNMETLKHLGVVK